MSAVARTAVREAMLAEIRRRAEVEDAHAARARNQHAEEVARRAARYWRRLPEVVTGEREPGSRDLVVIELLRRDVEQRLAAEAMHRAARTRAANRAGAVA